jgi:hypothetical protein
LRRKLQLLNLVLIALLTVVGFRFHQVWVDARAREQRVLNVRVKPEPAVMLPPLPPYTPVVAMNYLDVAQKMLLSKDRNPNVIYDPPAPPPPPPPMPALPQFYGLMMFGSPAIILSDKPGTQKAYRPGEKVGPFTLVAFDHTRVTFDWDGKKVERRLDELVAKNPPPSAANTQNVPAAAAAAPAPPAASISTSPLGPGADIGGGYRACQPNDATPSGTVKDGLRKVEVATPFGKSCRWETVK